MKTSRETSPAELLAIPCFCSYQPYQLRPAVQVKKDRRLLLKLLSYRLPGAII